MTKRILSLIILFSSIISFGQTSSFPDGVYLNMKQFRDRTPAYNTNLSVVKRSSGDIFMVGGNDYKIKSTVDSINKKYITQKIIAYVKNDSVYLNCASYALQTWFTLCNPTKGNYITFKACMSLTAARNVAMYGGAIASGLAAKKRILYVLDLTTNEVFELKGQKMGIFLQNRPDLLSNFKTEPDQDSEQVLMKYIDLMNQN
jgi:hypothetical protein